MVLEGKWLATQDSQTEREEQVRQGDTHEEQAPLPSGNEPEGQVTQSVAEREQVVQASLHSG